MAYAARTGMNLRRRAPNRSISYLRSATTRPARFAPTARPTPDSALGTAESGSTGPESDLWIAFRSAFQALENRIKPFTSLPLASLDREQAAGAPHRNRHGLREP